ncbi:hypothetical protein AAHB53_10895 [Niallia circulans]
MNKVLSLQKQAVSKDVQLKAKSLAVFNVKEVATQAGSSVNSTKYY